MRLSKISAFLLISLVLWLLAFTVKCNLIRAQVVTSTPIPTSTLGNIVNIPPLDDAYVDSSLSSGNFGDSIRLEIDGSPAKITYFKFDLRGLANEEVTSAKLMLRVVDDAIGASTSTQNIKEVSDNNWSEKLITYSIKPDLGNTITTIPGGIIGSFIEIDLTTYVQNNIGKVVSLGIDSQGSDGLAVYSKEYTISDQIPLLVVAKISGPKCVIAGDANGDGKVSGVDYVIWLNHYNQYTSGGCGTGDFNNDGRATGIDYVIWLNNYGI